MTYTKQVVVHTNWIYDLDGKTVADAIAYLQKLDQTHILNYNLEGDTHGCELYSNMYYNVPMTDSEIYISLETRYLKEIAQTTAAKSEHIRRGRLERAERCDILLLSINTKLQAAKIKYTTKENTI